MHLEVHRGRKDWIPAGCRTMDLFYEDLAKMIDHSLLQQQLTDAELEQGCKLARELNVASVCIKPYAVKRAAELLKGTGVFVGAVIGFPHGNSATESKRERSWCRDRISTRSHSYRTTSA